MSTSPPLQALFWSAATICFYSLARFTHQRLSQWWTTPVLLAPVCLLALALLMHEQYRDYISGTHWLVLMLGPATVAFASPIYQQRATIRRNWQVLISGAVVGSSVAIMTSWTLAGALDIPESLKLSLVPRSMSTPFAMAVSSDIGGVPELTAMFVILTGLVGATIGQGLLRWLPLRSGSARGALFGMGAHGIGAATARQIGNEEGSTAGLVMILAGVLNVLAAPLLAYVLHQIT